MKISVTIKILLRSICIPLLSIFLLNRFNVFNHIDFVPMEDKHSLGLTVYVSIIGIIWGIFEEFIERKKVKIVCVFYTTEASRDLRYPPHIGINNQTGVATVNYHIELSGDCRILKDIRLYLNLPPWLGSQVHKSDKVLTYEGNCIKWEFADVLPRNKNFLKSVIHRGKIVLIKNENPGEIVIELIPEINKCLWCIFDTNGFNIQSEE